MRRHADGFFKFAPSQTDVVPQTFSLLGYSYSVSSTNLPSSYIHQLHTMERSRIHLLLLWTWLKQHQMLTRPPLATRHSRRIHQHPSLLTRLDQHQGNSSSPREFQCICQTHLHTTRKRLCLCLHTLSTAYLLWRFIHASIYLYTIVRYHFSPPFCLHRRSKSRGSKRAVI